MTTIVGQVKPALEDLSHHGVLGMKWGVRRQKATGHDIRVARKTLKRERQAITAVDRAARKASTPQEREQLRKQADRMEVAFLRNPNRAVAVRMTKGEKILSILTTLPFGGSPGLAVIAGTSLASRRIEYKQDTGAYKK